MMSSLIKRASLGVKTHDRIGFKSLSSVTAKSKRPSRAEFRRACAQFATGITVVTTRAADGAPHGLTANSFTSVSAEPPLVLVCIDFECSVLAHFQECEFFAINILAENQQAISVRFAETPDGRFEGLKWWLSANGVPILADTLGVLECKVAQRIAAGDHVILLGEVLAADHRAGQPLLYYSSRYQHLQIQPHVQDQG